ncbi:MAG TPA: SCO family protein [Rhizomicrobium sp.]|jgi:protein SCO1/2|nr:SCO family protein [Rhizomicrobium sp.]
MPRSPLALVPYFAAVAFVLAGTLWHAGDRLAGLGRTVTSGTASIGGPFTLIDQYGRSRTPADFRGRFMLVYFGYSFCPDVCPTTLAEMAAALDLLGTKRERIAPVFVSIDPKRDTPAVLREYMRNFGPDFVGLTGSEKSIAAAARAYRVYVRKHPLPGGNYTMDHSGVIYLMGPDGRFVTYYEAETGPAAIAQDLRNRI